MSKLYSIHSMFKTIQGEGYHAGRPAVFIRFSGCNVWSGHEKDRERDGTNSLCARVCDTVFAGQDVTKGGGLFTAQQVVDKVNNLWAHNIDRDAPFVVLTGGEPSLQADMLLIDELGSIGSYIAVETNGSKDLPDGIDWITLSPKPPVKVELTSINELKVLFPLFDPAALLKQYEDLFIYDSFGIEGKLFVSPVNYDAIGGPLGTAYSNSESLKACIDFVMANPQWRLSLQTHKFMKGYIE